MAEFEEIDLAESDPRQYSASSERKNRAKGSGWARHDPPDHLAFGVLVLADRPFPASDFNPEDLKAKTAPAKSEYPIWLRNLRNDE